MVTVSHSKLSTFEQCPQKYKFGYIDKIDTGIKSIEAFMGDMVHRALEKLYKDLKFEKLNTEQDLVDFYHEEWEKHWEDSILVVKKQYTKDNYKDKGERMIRDYYKKYHPFNQETTIGLETQWYYDLNEEHKIHVRIDRLAMPEEGVYEIHDYKTNSSLKTQEELDKDRQLAVYSMGVKKQFPDAKKVILVWHFLDFNKEMRSTRTTQELEELRKEVISLIGEIEKTDEYPPRQSPLCDYCEFKQICPLWKHLFITEEKTVEEFKKDDGVKLVDEYASLKEDEKKLSKKIDELSENIKKYSEQLGVKSLFGSNNSVMVWSKDVIKFPGKNDSERDKFKEALKALNLYNQYLDIDNWALEKDFDSLNEIEKQVLRKLGRQQKIFRLYLKEKKD